MQVDESSVSLQGQIRSIGTNYNLVVILVRLAVDSNFLIRSSQDVNNYNLVIHSLSIL